MIGELLVFVLFLVMRPGLNVQARSSCSSSGRFPFCADSNGDGRIDIGDAVHTTSRRLAGQELPHAPGPGRQGPEKVLSR